MGLMYDAAMLPCLWAEMGYWGLRVRGITDDDIRGSIVLGCGAAALIAMPSAREALAFAALFPSRLSRSPLRFYQERWFRVVRMTVLAFTIAGSCALLVLTPSLRSQADPYSLPNVVSRHEAQISTLESSVQEIRADVRALKNDQENFFWWLRGIGMIALTSIIGFNLKNLYNDYERGRRTRERFEARDEAQEESEA